MPNVIIEIARNIAVPDQAVEIVERKGTGHPDSICDAAMEAVSVALSREYIKHFGRVLHHNIDKGLLVAGKVEKHFGGGRVLRPMELIVGDRAATGTDGNRIDVAGIAVSTVKNWLRENLPHINPDRDIDIRVVLDEGSPELTGIFTRPGQMVANDTSAAVGYAPLTPTEKAVYETERFINSPAFKLRFPEAGEDVKVMGVRKGADLDITIACPLRAGLVKSEEDYFEKKATIYGDVKRFLLEFPFNNVNLEINSLDRPGFGLEGVYLTLLGTSAEDADSGEVGRGNRVNGVISLNRPMGTEAAAGKNPVSHAGKIYSVLAHRISGEIYKRVEGVKEVYTWLLSRIGSPVAEPSQVYVIIIPEGRLDTEEAGAGVRRIVEEFLSGVETFSKELIRGEHRVC